MSNPSNTQSGTGAMDKSKSQQQGKNPSELGDTSKQRQDKDKDSSSKY